MSRGPLASTVREEGVGNPTEAARLTSGCFLSTQQSTNNPLIVLILWKWLRMMWMRFKVETVIINYHYGSVAAHDDYRCLALHNNNFSFGCCLDGKRFSLDAIHFCINRVTVLIDNDRAFYYHRAGGCLCDGMVDNCADCCTEDERTDAAMIVGGWSVVNISVVGTAIVASVVAVVTRLCENCSCGAGYYQYEG